MFSLSLFKIKTFSPNYSSNQTAALFRTTKQASKQASKFPFIWGSGSMKSV
jgi:hypothetical protein